MYSESKCDSIRYDRAPAAAIGTPDACVCLSSTTFSYSTAFYPPRLRAKRKIENDRSSRRYTISLQLCEIHRLIDKSGRKTVARGEERERRRLGNSTAPQFSHTHTYIGSQMHSQVSIYLIRCGWHCLY